MSVRDEVGWLSVPSAVSDHWFAAIDDAGIARDAAALLGCPVLPDSGQLAAYVGIDRHVDLVLPDALLADLNDVCGRLAGQHRVVLLTDNRPIEMDAALLRHELQHARHLTANPRLWDLAELCEDVVRLAPSESGRLYNRIPTEQDANAAAHRFAVEQFGAARVAEVLALVSDAPALRGDAEAVDIDDLPNKMVDFLATISDLCRAYAALSSLPFRRRSLRRPDPESRHVPRMALFQLR